jgi:hypothetical protein
LSRSCLSSFSIRTTLSPIYVQIVSSMPSHAPVSGPLPFGPAPSPNRSLSGISPPPLFFFHGTSWCLVTLCSWPLHAVLGALPSYPTGLCIFSSPSHIAPSRNLGRGSPLYYSIHFSTCPKYSLFQSRSASLNFTARVILPRLWLHNSLVAYWSILSSSFFHFRHKVRCRGILSLALTPFRVGLSCLKLSR